MVSVREETQDDSSIYDSDPDNIHFPDSSNHSETNGMPCVAMADEGNQQ